MWFKSFTIHHTKEQISSLHVLDSFFFPFSLLLLGLSVLTRNITASFVCWIVCISIQTQLLLGVLLTCSSFLYSQQKFPVRGMEKESLNSGEKLTRRETQPPVETRSALPGSNGRRPFIVKTLAKVLD